VKFQDFVDGMTVTSQVDEVTGLSSTVVLDTKQRGGKEVRATIKLLSNKGKEVTSPTPRSGGLHPASGRARQSRGRRTRVAGRCHRAHPAGVFQDPRHHRRLAARADLFEARKPKDPAILAEKSGTVSFGKETKASGA